MTLRRAIRAGGETDDNESGGPNRGESGEAAFFALSGESSR